MASTSMCGVISFLACSHGVNRFTASISRSVAAISVARTAAASDCLKVMPGLGTGSDRARRGKKAASRPQATSRLKIQGEAAISRKPCLRFPASKNNGIRM